MPGHDVFLKEAGLRYSFLESHGLTDAFPRPSFGVHAPIVSPGGIVFFGRDMESSRQVWSAESGYPGDFDYREFYKDVGWELPMKDLEDFLPDGQRKNLGIKYYRVTGRGTDLGHKQPYVRAWAMEKAASHAGNFLGNRQKQVEHHAGAMGRTPIVVSPYDAELYGHWWYEGPQFLDFLFRKMHFDQDVVKPTTPSEYLHRFGELEVCQPPMCTWGASGYAEVWLNGSNDWIYPHLDMAAERMVELARRYEHPNDLERRALDQAARELLLAQSSDWAFIMKTNTTVEYAKKRTRDHVARLDYLYRALTGQCMLEEPILREFEEPRQRLPGDRLPGLPMNIRYAWLVSWSFVALLAAGCAARPVERQNLPSELLSGHVTASTTGTWYTPCAAAADASRMWVTFTGDSVQQAERARASGLLANGTPAFVRLTASRTGGSALVVRDIAEIRAPRADDCAGN